MLSETVLNNFGLKDKKAAVYLAVLEIGSSTVLPLAQRAGIQRTTAYDILEDLQMRGLVSCRELRGRRYYQASDPRHFQQILERQQKELNEAMPELLELYKPSKEKPAVRTYQGKDEIGLIYDEIAKAQRVDAYGNFDQIERYYPEFSKYVKKHLRRGVRARDIYVRTPNSEKYRPLYSSSRQQVRFLPSGMSIETDTIIFDNKIAMISYGETVHGVVIESKPIADTQRLAFEQLWAISEP